MKSDIETIDKREMADKTVRDNRNKNDEVTAERRFKADETLQKNRLKNDEITAHRREIKDENSVRDLTIALGIVTALAVVVLFILR